MSSSSSFRVLVIPTSGDVTEKHLPNDEAIGQIVEGYLEIAPIRLVSGYVIYCDADARVKKPVPDLNPLLSVLCGMPIYGPAVVSKADEEGATISVPESITSENWKEHILGKETDKI
jgi:hypothetical protein